MEKQTFRYRKYHGSVYLTVFYHDFSGGYFQNINDTKIYIDINDRNKFSILDYISNIKRYNDSEYEFLINYPEYDIFCHWKQNVSPLELDENIDADPSSYGFVNYNPRCTNFTGLRLSNETENTLLDGDERTSYITKYFRYAIGVVDFDSKLPGPIIENSPFDTNYVELLMRVPILGYTCKKNPYMKPDLLVFLFINHINK